MRAHISHIYTPIPQIEHRVNELISVKIEKATQSQRFYCERSDFVVRKQKRCHMKVETVSLIVALLQRLSKAAAIAYKGIEIHHLCCVQSLFTLCHILILP